jgi:8-oxo-dGTP pyrophosphatase MutT (NUDIX family)
MEKRDSSLSRLNELLKNGQASAWAGVILHDIVRVLLVRDRSKGESGMWCIPGGGYEHDDGSVKMAAARELYQETGVFIDKSFLSPAYLTEIPDQISGGVHIKCFFSCEKEGIIGTTTFPPKSEDILRIEWKEVMVKDGDLYIFFTKEDFSDSEIKNLSTKCFFTGSNDLILPVDIVLSRYHAQALKSVFFRKMRRFCGA